MSLANFMIHVFCLIDDYLAARSAEEPLRQRGPAPTLADSGVLTCEVHRTTFTRKAANLWVLNRDLWQHFLAQTHYLSELSIIDSFPMPACRFARAKRCKRLAGEAAFGYDEMAKQTL